MKKILTIISEYNPFHLGHEYHLNESIKQINPDYKVAIISGNFVQRGEPSIINKWEKAKVAITAGFDLIIELPCIYSISSAENFANGAIKIANEIGTTHLSFGSEDGKVENLNKLSQLISENENTYIKKIKEKIALGNSYPKSQELVINEMFSNEFENICSPNNILGLEYLKSIKKLNSTIKAITIKRNFDFNSSSNIRSILRNSQNLSIKILPKYSLNAINENINSGSLVYSLKNFEKEILFTLRKMTIEDLKNIPDLPENLLNKFKKASNSCNSLEELISILKNKSITQARIQRILLYILLSITKKDMEISKSTTPYLRILATNQKGKELLSDISKKTPNVITSVKQFEEKCQNQSLLKLLEIDKLATNIYTLAYTQNSKSNLDYTTKIIERN
ncbi:MAG: nucleotidyltransferase family protein [Clostridia bacterium]|nr:nucleotidyltransferase family protein [Clostridia bacterium]